MNKPADPLESNPRRYCIWLDDELLDLIRRAAASEERPVSSWVRHTLRTAALIQRRRARLTDRPF